MRIFLSRSCLVAAVLLLIAGLDAQAADQTMPPRAISVTGQGKVQAASNVADVTIGVVSQANTAQAALTSNSQRMEGLQKILSEQGVAANDIQTSEIVVRPLQNQPPAYPPGQRPAPAVPKVTGYQVQNSVRVTVRDLKKLGSLLDAVVAGGADQVYGVQLRTDDAGLMNEARKKAMADAKSKAELLAGEAGMTVGLPVSIREESNPYSVAPPAAPPGGFYPLGAPAASVPVAPGQQETVATVSVVFELKAAK
jgi:uncharacterized protein